MRSVDIIRYMDDNCILDSRSLSADLIERDLSKHVEKQLVTALGDLPRHVISMEEKKNLTTCLICLKQEQQLS